MSHHTFTAIVRSSMNVARLLGFIFLLSLGSAHAQSSRTITDGYTPTSLAPGAPAGSYPLSGFDNINLFNGNLNFRLPLLTVGGRGTAGYTITLPIEKHWYVYRYYPEPDPTYYYQDAQYDYGYNDKVGYGPGILITRRASSDSRTSVICPSGAIFVSLTTRLVFAGPDGTQYQLYDQAYNGGSHTVNLCADPLGALNRGRVFASDDGKSMTFISDTDIIDYPVPFTEDTYPTGNLMMRDGAMYRIVNGKVQWIRDRNGNKVSFTYMGLDDWRVSTITDPLNRQITISYNNQLPSYDAITFRCYGGATRTIKIWHDAMGQALRPGATIQKANQLFPQIYAVQTPWTGDWYHDPAVVSSVELPSGQRYYFYYNSYGELARAILPTGGGFDYDYVGASPIPNGGSVVGLAIYRRLIKRTVYNTLTATTDPNTPPAGTVEEKSLYSNVYQDGAPNYTIVTVEHRSPSPAPDGALLALEKHYLYGDPTDGMFGGCPPDSSSPWPQGKEAKVEFYDVTGGTLGGIRNKVEYTWYPAVTFRVYGCSSGPDPDPRIVETVTTLADTNQVSKQTFAHDQYNNVTDVWEYDFGPDAAGSLIRHTHTDYVTFNNGVDYAAETNIHIRNLPSQQQVFDAADTKRAENIYKYDNYNHSSPDLFHAALTDCQNISGHDGSFSTAYYSRGNVTKTTRSLLDNIGSVIGSISSYTRYDIAGNVVALIDPRSTDTPPNIIATTFDFSDNFGSPDDPTVRSGEDPANNAPGELGGQMSYAFPFKVTNALGHKAYTKYDYYLGRLVLREDVNGVKSNIYFNDALDRPTRGVRAIGTSVASQTVFVYNDSDSPVNGYPARSITTISDKDVFGESNSGNGLKSVSLFDGLGRPFRGAAYEGSTWTINDTKFDARGSVSQVSNTYRAADPGSASPPAGLLTTTKYDALDRVIEVTTPDTATASTEYSGNRTLAIDQSGKERISQTDALGRLTNVWEVRSPDAASGTVSISFPNHPEITAGYQTDYLYDALNNLRKVMQGAQTRWFAYDSLSHLIRAKNPEQADILVLA